MSDDIDYNSVAIDPDKSPEAYSYVERRSEILKLIFQAGTPSALSQYDLADRYDVSQPMISKDFDTLEGYLADNRTDRRHLNLAAVKERVIKRLLKAGETDWRAARAAWDVSKEWEEWLTDREDLAELSKRFDVIEERQARAKYR